MKGGEAPRHVSELNEFKPLVLTSRETVTKLLANEQEAGRLNIKLVLVLLAAEGLPLDGYERIVRVFIAKVGNSHAASECPFISHSCEYRWLRIYKVFIHGYLCQEMRAHQ